jgi:pyrophosphatase PpaX
MKNNKKYNYILFDWDGTLARTLDVWFEAEKEMLKQYGITIPDEQLISSFGDWEFGKKLGVKDNDKFIQELLVLVDEMLKRVELYANTKEVLLKLIEKGKRLALVTTAKKQNIEPQLERFGFKDIFEVVLTAEDVTNHKPDPEVVNKAIDILNAKKEETLIIGDGPKDIQAGKLAGITTVSFYPKENERFYSEASIKSHGADFVINNLLDLLKVVN